MHRTSRRSFLKKTATMVAAGMATFLPRGSRGHSVAATKVSLALDFVILGRHSPFYLALQRGLWGEHGLEVAISRGFGNVDTAKRVAQKQADFGFSDLPAVALLRAQGARLVQIAMIYQNWPHVIFAKPNVRIPKDLEGRVFGTPAGTTGTQLMPAFAEAAGFDWGKVKVVNLDIATQNAALVSGQVDAISTFRFFVPFFRSKMNDVSMIAWNDYGWKMYSNGIVVHEDTLSQKGDMVRSFLEGTLLGYRHAMANPDEAVAALVKHRPEVAVDAAKAEQPFIKELVVAGGAAERGIGHFDSSKIQFSFDQLYRYAELPRSVTAKEVLSDKLLPMVKP